MINIIYSICNAPHAKPDNLILQRRTLLMVSNYQMAVRLSDVQLGVSVSQHVTQTTHRPPTRRICQCTCLQVRFAIVQLVTHTYDVLLKIESSSSNLATQCDCRAHNQH